MASYRKFEDLKVWQDSRSFNRDVYILLKSKNNVESGFLKNHILKTAGSLMDNIAEGFERGGNKEFIQFISIAKGSAGELRSQLYRAIDSELIDELTASKLTPKIISISSQLSLFIQYLKNSELKGDKFKEPNASYQPNLNRDQFFID